MSPPQRLNHYGRPANWFMDYEPEFLDALVADMRRIELLFRLEFGLPLYLTWGTLLGAVREGDFIGYDCDIDLAYVSKAGDPDAILREHAAIESCLRGFGRVANAPHAGRLFLQSEYHAPSGKVPFGIEIYTSWIEEERLYVYPSIPGVIPAAALLPFSQVTLRRQFFNAPVDTDSFLAVEYGADWRRPVEPSDHQPQLIRHACFDFLRTDLQ